MKPVIWVGDSLRVLKMFPSSVQDEVGYALYIAQSWREARVRQALEGPWVGRAGSRVRSSGRHVRAVYTVRLADRVYVLHAFQKKSKRGIATPQLELDLIRRRLKMAVAIAEAEE